MTELSTEQRSALKIAHRLVDLGVPLFVAAPNSARPGEYLYPHAWQTWKPNRDVVDRWRPGMCLAMVCGVVFDVIDVDPRNGGDIKALIDQEAMPTIYGSQDTPSAGRHLLIARTHLAKGKPAEGIDLQAGDDQGNGRGFIFLAPTVRISKYGANKGQEVAYRWDMAPLPVQDAPDLGLDALIRISQEVRPSVTIGAMRPAAATDDDLFEPVGGEPFTPEQARAIIDKQLATVRNAKPGQVNPTLGGAARVFGRFIAGGFLAKADLQQLHQALADGGVHSDDWNRAHHLLWTADSVITAGYGRGAQEPWLVREPEMVQEEGSRLQIGSAAAMAYWLQEHLGVGRLSGFFARSGQMVHTPRVNELGYVPAKAGGDNGPVEIQPITGPVLAAKLQYLYECYKRTQDKETEEWKEAPALFPRAATQVAVDAPEALHGLRVLRGITSTPMVRSDGSVLDTPGYDQATGYLFLPGDGVDVPMVPERPTEGELRKAVDLLYEMIAGFPFAGDDDRANYLGLLLTPLLREVTPPTYKMFGLGAHQPGSGKTLLAQLVGLIHGTVFRPEVPSEEAEWSKMTTSILATTSAPTVILDNVTGVLRSSVLAGLLTASGEIQERELGKSSNLIFRNDRVWIITGNNLSIGGDLVRRTVTVLIDPNMINPETRTGFAIEDLPGWVTEHRNDILWSLLVLIRAWVVQGMPEPVRAQSDSYARWERVVAGILAVAGVPGQFDAESGKRAAAGGDDDGLALVLEHLVERFKGESFNVAQALAPQSANGQFLGESRDWLPAPVVEKLARSEASGRIAMGWWLRNRLGRWVSGTEGRPLVLRPSPAERRVARYRVETK